jgi:hypothetical protein
MVAQHMSKSIDGLHPPILATTDNLVTGVETNNLQRQNRRQHHALQDKQLPASMWMVHMGTSILPPAQVHLATEASTMESILFCPLW